MSLKSDLMNIRRASDVNALLVETDSASSMKRLNTHTKHAYWDSARVIVFVIYCCLHQNNRIQSMVLQQGSRLLQLMYAPFSASLLLREGMYWHRALDSLEGAVLLKLRVQLRDLDSVPTSAEGVSRLFAAFVALGLRADDEHARTTWRELIDFIGGDVFSPHIIHKCSGCCNTFEDSVTTCTRLFRSTICSAKPTIPQLARWSKAAMSLYVWGPGMLFCNIVLVVFSLAFLPDKTAAERVGVSLQELLAAAEAAWLRDSDSGYKALMGVRIHKTFATIERPETRGELCLLLLSFAAIRSVNGWFQGRTRASRSSKANCKEKPRVTMPPCLDLTYPPKSPIELVQQFHSCVLATETAIFTDLLDKLRRVCASEDGVRGWQGTETRDNIRQKYRGSCMQHALTPHASLWQQAHLVGTIG